MVKLARHQRASIRVAKFGVRSVVDHRDHVSLCKALGGVEEAASDPVGYGMVSQMT